MPTTVPFQMIYLCAPNDANGNPRRAWFLLNDFGCAVHYWPEGYSGSDVVPEKFTNARLSAPHVYVTLKELNSWIKSVI